MIEKLGLHAFAVARRLEEVRQFQLLWELGAVKLVVVHRVQLTRNSAFELRRKLFRKLEKTFLSQKRR